MVAQLRQHRSRLAAWSMRFGLLAPVVMVLAGLGHRFNAIDTPVAFAVIAASVFLAGLAVVTAIAGLFRIWRRGDSGTGAAIRGMLLGLLVLAIPGYAAWQLVALPRLADVSTSPENPPRLIMAAINRPASANAVTDPTLEEASLQRQAYPELTARFYQRETGFIFQHALALAEQRRWRILDVLEPLNADEVGRIEAVARTPFFAFEDDVVIELTPLGDGTRVDMRSASRYGRHDLGTNARRIRQFLAALDDAMTAGEVSNSSRE